mmetsp:Transcript_35469/g.82298  ORF Transcript_35469/g.82298 Transcript_35469/m.82298 type:complete len:203 (+) Transcript_35469:3105-3713(+)
MVQCHSFTELAMPKCVIHRVHHLAWKLHCTDGVTFYNRLQLVINDNDANAASSVSIPAGVDSLSAASYPPGALDANILHEPFHATAPPTYPEPSNNGGNTHTEPDDINRGSVAADYDPPAHLMNTHPLLIPTWMMKRIIYPQMNPLPFLSLFWMTLFLMTTLLEWLRSMTGTTLESPETMSLQEWMANVILQEWWRELMKIL